MRFLNLLTIPLLLLTISFSAASQTSGQGEELNVEEIYKKIAEQLEQVDMEAYYKQEENLPESFKEIDRAFENMQNYMARTFKKKLREQGVKFEGVRPGEMESQIAKMKNVDFSNLQSDPEFIKIKNKFSSLMKEAQEKGLNYQLPIMRDPLYPVKAMGRENPNAIKEIAKYMKENKAQILGEIKKTIEASKSEFQKSFEKSRRQNATK